MHLALRLSISLALSCGVVACDSDAPATSPTPPTSSTPDGGDPNVASKCTPPVGAGTTHASIDGDETWTAAASPHVVSTSLAIGAGRTLTLEPCAVVRIAGGAGMTVEGKLLAAGAADRPITIERADANEGWSSITTRAGAELRLSWVTVDGGGNPNGGRLTQAAALDIRGDQESAPQPILFVDHVAVKGSGSLGLWVREGGGFAAGSTDLVVTGGKTFPVLVWGRAAGGLPTGSYGGNAIDEIFLPAIGGRDDVKEDMTLHARGVPYRVGGETAGTSFVVGASSGAPPLLTIEAGVTMRFAKGTRLLVSGTGATAQGALRAKGTPSANIVFTSAEATPAAGDWTGILFAGAPDPRDEIAYAKIAYAGGTSGVSSYDCSSPLATSFANEGAIVIYGGKPASAFVTQTAIEASAGDGIIRGWTGDPVDFLPTNVFTGVARCHQTFPKPSVGVCPDPAPCPQ